MKLIQGKVVSIAMNKTIVVEVNRTKIHPLYKKIMRRTSRFKAHNENKLIKIGDTVILKQSKPISKEKHYIVENVLLKTKKEKK